MHLGRSDTDDEAHGLTEALSLAPWLDSTGEILVAALCWD